jgi:carbon monoxide dehydrogenase subunit G
MLKKIAIVLVVLIAAILGFAATKPDTFSVARTTTIKAPPEKIVPLIADFHRWPSWSPFEKLDPKMNRTLSGATAGPGAIYAWSGNSQAGEGRMEVIDASPSKVTIKLDFTKPFASNNIAEFTLVPHGETTDVTWSMRGPQLFVGKVMSVFMSMDKMVGKEFETGLTSLKAIAERS